MDLIQAAARNQAAWADKQLRAHGIDCRYSELLWTCWQGGTGTDIHPHAITLAPGAGSDQRTMLKGIERLTAAREQDQLEVIDWWRAMDLTPLGFEPIWNTDTDPAPYLLRPSGDSPFTPLPSELEISEVRTSEELSEFEETAHEAYEPATPYSPGCWHASASLHDADTRYFLGRVGGIPVSTSIAVISDGVVGLFGVATRPAFRQRGYGAAVTWTALRCAPDLPAVLGPSDMAESMYRTMGFKDFHGFRKWRREGAPGAAG